MTPVDFITYTITGLYLCDIFWVHNYGKLLPVWHVFWECQASYLVSLLCGQAGLRGGDLGVWLDTPTCVLDPRVASDTRQGYLTPQILEPPPLLQDLFLSPLSVWKTISDNPVFVGAYKLPKMFMILICVCQLFLPEKYGVCLIKWI